jgi:hypothetical protein
MQVAEIVVIVLLLAAVALAVLLAVRRASLSRSGAVNLGWRDQLDPEGRGWVLGQARYTEDRLDLYRSFSPMPVPAKHLPRASLRLGGRRAPVGTELDLLPPGSVVVRCANGGAELELAMAESALTGLRSWLESAPPGSTARRLSRGQG